MAKPDNLFSREFLILNFVFFVAAMATAVFFQLHQYLRFLGISQSWSGFIIAADALPALILQPLLGVFLNNFNARKWLLFGAICMIAALLSYKVATSVTTLVLVRTFQGAGFACLVAALMVMVVEHIPPQKSGSAFGIISTIRLLPYAFVPPLMSAYFSSPQDFIKALAYCVVPMVFSLVVILLIKTPGIIAEKDNLRHSVDKKQLLENFKDRNVSIVLIISLLLYSGYAAVFFFLEGYYRKAGVENPGLFFTVVTFTMIGIRAFGNTMLDKYNKVRLTFWSMVGLVVCYSCLPVTSFTGHYYILAFFTGAGYGVVMPVLIALVFDLSAPHFRGLNLNLSLLMMQGGFFAGPFLGGVVQEYLGYGALFYFCAFLGLLSAMLTLGITKRNKSMI